jgi:hypothetical protein
MTNRPTGIDAKNSQTYTSIEREAARVRKAFGLSFDKPVKMSEVFEFLIDDYQVVLPHKTVPMTVGVEKLTTEALTRWNPDSGKLELLLSEEWYPRLCEGYARASFTVGHELGHAVLHTQTLLELGDLNLKSQAALHRGLKDHPTYRDTEWQANSFSAAFLMPFEGIKGLTTKMDNLTDWGIANHFGVSAEAAFIRLDVIRRGKLGRF